MLTSAPRQKQKIQHKKCGVYLCFVSQEKKHIRSTPVKFLPRQDITFSPSVASNLSIVTYFFPFRGGGVTKKLCTCHSGLVGFMSGDNCRLDFSIISLTPREKKK